LLEANKDVLEEDLKLEGSPGGFDFPIGLPTPAGSPSLSDAEGPDGSPPAGSPPAGSPPLSSPLGSGGDDEEQMEYYPDSDDEADFDDKDGAKAECKEEFKVEVKEETIVKEEVKVELKKERPAKAAVEISLDSDDEGKEEVIDSEDSVHDIDSCDVSDDEVYESLSSGGEESDGVEYVDSSFKAPRVAASLRMVSEHFVFRCLGTLFTKRGPMWARPKIDAFFQDVFYRRSIFTTSQQVQVEAWQARIKVMQKNGERDVGDANNPLEAHRPVVDSREMRTSIESAGGDWAAKQTFDSRDKAGGSRTIR